MDRWISVFPAVLSIIGYRNPFLIFVPPVFDTQKERERTRKRDRYIDREIEIEIARGHDINEINNV